MSEWREMKLGDVCELKRGYDLPNASRRNGTIPIISSSGPTGFHDEAKVSAPGVVTGRYGTLGEVFYVQEDFWPLNTALYVRDFKGNDPRYVAALLRSMKLAQYDGAAAVPGLNRNQLHTVPVRIPTPDVQHVIASVLSSFDDLIENDRRRVEVLEEMARAIYREWFVHFRFPGYEEVELLESDLGPIPDGWRVAAVSEIASIDKGLSYKGAFLTPGGVPMANLKCIAPGGGFRRDGTKPYSGPFKPKHSVKPGDLVIANTDLTQAGAVIGSPALIPRRGFELGGLLSHHLFAVRVRDATLTPFLYQEFAGPAFRAYARGVASGTTVLGLRPADILAYQFALPPGALLGQYSALANDIQQTINDLNESTETVAAIRDALLPKLVSGQLDVSSLDLDALFEGAVA